jgi:hypothetical protein
MLDKSFFYVYINKKGVFMNNKTVFGILILLIGLFIIGCDGIIKDNDLDNGNTNNNESDNSGNNTNNNGNNNVDLTFTAVENFSFNQGKGTIYSDIYDIAYGNGKFVAVGIAGQIAYSTDGSNWTKSQNNAFRMNDSNVQGITYGNGRFVAFGSRGNVVSNGQVSTWWDIVYSSNGSNWTRADTSNFDGAISKIIYGGDKFLAVSGSGKIAYSSNGSLWIPITDSALNNVTFSSVAYGAGKYIAVGSSGKMGFSSDGINWTIVISGSFSKITYLNDRYIAWGNGNIAESSDGTTWRLLVNTSFNSIVYGAGKFVSLSGNNIKYSIDNCVTWIQADSKLDNGINGMAYGNGIFIVVGMGYGSSRQIAYSNKQE